MNLNFVSDGTLDKILAKPTRTITDIQREAFRRKLKHIADDTEQATDYCRRLMREGADVSEELKELAQTGNGLALVAGILKLETERK